MASNEMLDNVSFQALMNSVGRGDRAAQQALYRFFPETASKGAGRTIGTKGLVTPRVLSRGAMSVAKMGSRRLPLLAGGIQALSGDVAGGVGTAGGGIVGGMLGAPLGPVGVLAGSWLGSSIGSGLAQGITGLDPSNPLAGPDWNLGPIALTPYARTKKDLKKQLKLAEMQLPLYNKIANKELERKMQRDALQQTSQMVSNIYSTNPYMR
tara:strand:+ start:103 stop:732 length:630 start_codon:yes stop_codon:yes gene_type:complete